MSYHPAVEQAARAAARDLVPEYGEQVEAQVEAALHSTGEDNAPDQYFDPVAVGGLIVAIATLAWTIYNDMRSRGEKPTREGVARITRDHRRKKVSLTAGDLKIIETVTTEVIEYGAG